MATLHGSLDRSYSFRDGHGVSYQLRAQRIVKAGEAPQRQ